MANPNGIGSPNAVLQHGRLNYIPTAFPSAGTLGTDIFPQGTKFIQTEPLVAQSAAASTIVTSAAITVPSGVTYGVFYLNLGRGNTTAVAGSGTTFRIEVSAKTAGSDSWMPTTTWAAASAASNSSASSSDCTAGTTIISITTGATTMMTKGDFICLSSGTIEWARITGTTGTASFTIQDATTYSHVSQTGIFGGASNTAILVDMRGIVRTRVVVDNNVPSTAQPIFFRAACVLGM